MTLFSCRLLTTLISPIFARRLSSVLSKFSHKKINFRSGVTLLEVVTRAVRPLPPVTPLVRIMKPIRFTD